MIKIDKPYIYYYLTDTNDSDSANKIFWKAIIKFRDKFGFCITLGSSYNGTKWNGIVVDFNNNYYIYFTRQNDHGDYILELYKDSNISKEDFDIKFDCLKQIIENLQIKN